jgi:hypothetical protein
MGYVEIPHLGYVLGPAPLVQSDQSSSRERSGTSPSQERSPAFLLPLLAILGPMDRGLFVLLILPMGLLVLEPLFVLLAVGHGGVVEGDGLLI